MSNKAHTRRSPIVASALLFSLTAFTSTRSIFAVDYTYVGGTGDFESPSSWTPAGGPPNSNADKAIFGLAGTHSPGFSGDSHTVTNKAIEVRNGTVNLSLYKVDFFGYDSYTYALEPAVAGSGAVVATVGTTNGVSATLVIRGRPFEYTNLSVGVVDARGPLVLASVAGSTGRLDLGENVEEPEIATWTSTHATFVGTVGTGTLNVYRGSTLSDAGGVVGGFFANTGLGTANIKGTWNNSGSLTVGGNGTGTLNISGGGTVNTDGDAVVGLSAGESGTVNVTTVNGMPGQWTIDGTLSVGGGSSSAGGTGIMILNGAGATVTTGALTVWDTGDVNITEGKLTVNGALTLKTGSSLDLNGGHLVTSPSTFTIPTSTFNWTSGTLEFDEGYTIQTGHILGGSSLTVGVNKEFIVGGALNVGAGATVTLNGGTIQTQHLDALGTINVLGASTLKATGNVNIFSGAAITFSPTSTFNAAGAAITVSGTGTLVGGVTGNAMTSVTVSPAGIWTMPGSLEVGTSSSGLSRIGSLTLQGGATNVAGPVTVLDVTKFTLAGGTLNALSVELGGADFSGFGTINANFHTAGSVIATGNLTIGNANSQAGTVIGGTLDVGSQTVAINKKGFYSIGNSSNITGGTLIVANGVAIPVGDTLEAHGTIDAKVVAQSGSLIEATGDLVLGSDKSPAGFFSDGELMVNQFTVTINDANEALLGSLTTLGQSGVRPGTLVAANGAVVEFGKNIVGVGTVDTPDDPTRPLVNNGTIWGESAEYPITLLGHVKGVGTFDDVVFAGTFSPGFSPATAYLGSAVYAPSATLVIELGSTTPGSGHDQLVHSGTATLGGTLDVDLLGGFAPQSGSEFVIATYDSHVGQFSALDLPTLSGNLGWSLEYGPTSITLSVTTTRLPGDIDEDGDVDRLDAALFTPHLGLASGSDWASGDFNGDASTTLADLGLLQANFGASVFSPSAASAVPEPATWMMAMILTATILLGMARRRSQNTVGCGGRFGRWSYATSFFHLKVSQ